jgi:hypothetical protein
MNESVNMQDAPVRADEEVVRDGKPLGPSTP